MAHIFKDYYDGHFILSNRTLEEVEKDLEKSLEEDKKLTSWEDAMKQMETFRHKIQRGKSL